MKIRVQTSATKGYGNVEWQGSITLKIQAKFFMLFLHEKRKKI